MEQKAWEDMSIQELEIEYKRIEAEEFDTEWQYEFTRLELIELRKLIDKKRLLA